MVYWGVRLCVKAVTEPDSAESTEITDPVRTEPTEYNGKIRFPIPGFSFDNCFVFIVV